MADILNIYLYYVLSLVRFFSFISFSKRMVPQGAVLFNLCLIMKDNQAYKVVDMLFC